MYEIIFSEIIDSEIDQSYNYIKETLEAPRAAENLYTQQCQSPKFRVRHRAFPFSLPSKITIEEYPACIASFRPVS